MRIYEDFSILHTNIRSLSLRCDELVSLSAHTKLNLDVIGVSEIWHSNDNPILSNVDIPGFTFFETSSLTQNGGVGLYIRNSLTSKPRIDLDSCTDDFETVWVEIENKKDKDFLICCVYRHPSSKVDNLTSHFQNLLSKISSNKLVFRMGDFNVNLLDYASHTPTTDFVNNFFHTTFFHVFIIQPEFQSREPLLLITFTLMLLMPTLQVAIS